MAVLRLWPATNGPAAATVDADNYTLGTEFYVTGSAQFTGWYFWCNTASTVTFSLYQVNSDVSGTLIGQVSNVNLAAPLGEWKYQALAIPVNLTINQRYRACVSSTTNNFYSSTSQYWNTGPGSAGITNDILSAPNLANATGGDQGSFVTGGTPAFPTNGFNSTNYWIDPEVSTTDSAMDGELNLSMSRAIVIDGVRSPVGSLAGTVSRNIQVDGKRMPVGTINMTLNRNINITGGNVKSGSVSMNMSRNITITGQHPTEVEPPAPGNTRSDIEYNHQQFLYPGPEIDPFTMLDYFSLNGEDQAKLNRPPG